MDFALGEEQRLLQDSVARYLESNCSVERVRAAAGASETRAADIWRELSALGIHAVLIAEDYGGVGLGVLEAALIQEALGAAAAPIPYAASSVMAPVALAAAGSERQRDAWLPRIAAGEAVVGVGAAEHIGSRDGGGVHAAGGTLTGTALFVLDAMDADAFLLADDAGALHLVDARADGVRRTALGTIDRTRGVAEVALDSAPAQLLPGSSNSREPLLRMIDAGRVMLAADTLGAAQSMLDKAIAYAKERRQFDRPIGSFQAVKHLCAEMAAALEPCRALMWYAAHAFSAIPEESRLLACHAKAHLAETGTFVARAATEVHGGMGVTDLLGLHYWFKRIGFNRQMLGSPERARAEAARAQDWL